MRYFSVPEFLSTGFVLAPVLFLFLKLSTRIARLHGTEYIHNRIEILNVHAMKSGRKWGLRWLELFEKEVGKEVGNEMRGRIELMCENGLMTPGAWHLQGSQLWGSC